MKDRIMRKSFFIKRLAASICRSDSKRKVRQDDDCHDHRPHYWSVETERDEPQSCLVCLNG